MHNLFHHLDSDSIISAILVWVLAGVVTLTESIQYLQLIAFIFAILVSLSAFAVNYQKHKYYKKENKKNEHTNK